MRKRLLSCVTFPLWFCSFQLMLRLLFISIVSGMLGSISFPVVVLNCVKSSYCRSVTTCSNFRKLLCPCEFSYAWIEKNVKYTRSRVYRRSAAACWGLEGSGGRAGEGLTLYSRCCQLLQTVLFRRMSGWGLTYVDSIRFKPDTEPEGFPSLRPDLSVLGNMASDSSFTFPIALQ